MTESEKAKTPAVNTGVLILGVYAAVTTVLLLAIGVAFRNLHYQLGNSEVSGYTFYQPLFNNGPELACQPADVRLANLKADTKAVEQANEATSLLLRAWFPRQATPGIGGGYLVFGRFRSQEEAETNRTLLLKVMEECRQHLNMRVSCSRKIQTRVRIVRQNYDDGTWTLFVPGLNGPQTDQLIGYMADHWKYTGHGRECTNQVALAHDLYVDYDTIEQEANSVQDPPDSEDAPTEPEKDKDKEHFYQL